MKQIIQSLNSGETELVEVPAPTVQENQLLIKTLRTLISVGTEKMLIDFGKATLVNKVREQPDKVKVVLGKVKTDGLIATIDAVSAKLNNPIPLGYCNVGTVHKIGKNIKDFEKGDRVVSNGAHAEIVSCSNKLAAKIPENVSNDQASFTVLGAIALQGIRLSKATLGEAFVVMGMGVIGLLTVQLLRANGCRVLAVDFDQNRLNIAEKYGAKIFNLTKNDDLIKASDIFSRYKGVDGVIITASTKSNNPMHNAAKMCRRQGRIILVGITGLNLSRDDFYEKEITFQVSSSYGPGRYDENYESGNDYPIGFVRWTAQRNFEAVLDMISQGSLNVDKLITHSFDFNNALQAYKILAEPSGSLGILLKYGDGTFQNNKEKIELNKTLHDNKSPRPLEKINVGFIGTGNYANNILMPAFNNTGVTLQTAISKNGLSSFISGRKNKFNYCSNNEADILSDDNINLVVISTRHDTHAELVLKAIKAKKHIFLEKPLCLNIDELNLIRKASINYTSNLMIGFNRRFSPLSQKAKSLLDELSGPKSINYTINSGEIPLDHWTQDLNIGGGRIIGECCHFIDLLYFLVGSPIENYNKFTMKDKSGDTHTISLTFNDGSIGTINYFCNGSKSYPKEKLEMFCGGKVLELNNFRELRGFGWNNFKKLKLWKQDKGQRNCVADFVSSISEGKRSPIPLEQIFDIASVTLDIDTNC